MRRHVLIFVSLTLLLLAVSHPAAADDLLTYQGRLTNANGAIVPNANYGITFRLYSAMTGGTLLWSDQFTSVPTINGLFSVVLGSQATLDLGALADSSLYLEIQIYPSEPMTPRTLLTPAPRAAVASKLMGDVQTSNGAMIIRNDAGDSSLVLSRTPQHIAIQLFDPQPDPAGRAVLDIASDLSRGATISLFDPDPDPPARTLQLKSGVNTGSVIQMFDELADSSSTPRLELSSASSGASLKVFDPQPEPPGKLFELLGSSEDGPSLTFFDHGSEVMGVEPSPFNGGFSFAFFDPQQLSSTKMFEVATSYASSKSSRLSMYTVPVGGANQEILTMSGTGSAAELRMGLGAPSGATESLALLKSDATASIMSLTGPGGGPIAAPPVYMIANSSTARVGIGTNAPSEALHVIGNIVYTGTSGAVSDEEFKRDIEPIDDALDIVTQLSGVRYHWRTDEYPEYKFDSAQQIGVVAQQVKPLVPEVVMEQSDGHYAVDYSKLTPLLIEAVKELRAENQQLRQRLDRLEKQKH
jgi:hypothetical protein